MEARLARRVLAHSASWKEKERKLDSKDTIFKQPADGLLKGQYWQRYINDKNKDNPRRLRTHLFFWGGGGIERYLFVTLSDWSPLTLMMCHYLWLVAAVADWLAVATISGWLPLSPIGCHYLWFVASISDWLPPSLIGCHILWVVAMISDWLPYSLIGCHILWLSVTLSDWLHYLWLVATISDWLPPSLIGFHKLWLFVKTQGISI